MFRLRVLERPEIFFAMQSPNRLTDVLNPAPAVRIPRRSLRRSQVRRLLMLGDIVLVNAAALGALWLGLQRSTWWLAMAS